MFYNVTEQCHKEEAHLWWSDSKTVICGQHGSGSLIFVYFSEKNIDLGVSSQSRGAAGRLLLLVAV